MNLTALVISVLLQINWATPSWPALASPTPFVAPTAQAIPTVMALPEMQNGLATAQAQAKALPTTLAVQNNQMYYQGRPLLPNNKDTGQILGYTKWFVSSSSYSLTGPLSPIVHHLAILILLALVTLILGFLNMMVITIYKFFKALWDIVMQIIPG